MTAPRHAPAPFLERPLPDTAPALLELDDLVRFAEHPVRAFLRQRLGIRLGDFDDEVADSLTVELDNLERWGVGTRLLDGRLAGADMDACVAAEEARGMLPPGNLGAPVVERLRPEVDEIAAHALALTSDEAARSADVRVATADGRTLSGTVPGIHGDLLRAVSFSRVSPRHRIALWVRWLALTAAHPERPFEAVLVGRAAAGTDARVTVARLEPMAERAAARRERALELLAPLLDLHRAGLREPLPLPCLTSAAYAEHGEAAARKAWTSEWNFAKEDRDLEHELAFGGVLAFAELLDTTSFRDLAHRLWDGLLATEELVHR